MKRRRNDLKIPDIKALRGLTRLLGKCGIQSLAQTYEDQGYRDWCNQTGEPIDFDKLYIHRYGLGLKESKDYVESKYDYYLPANETEADRLRGANIIHLTKRTREFMSMLQRLGLRYADTGLQECKGFVTRQRN